MKIILLQLVVDMIVAPSSKKTMQVQGQGTFYKKKLSMTALKLTRICSLPISYFYGILKQLQYDYNNLIFPLNCFFFLQFELFIETIKLNKHYRN